MPHPARHKRTHWPASFFCAWLLAVTGPARADCPPPPAAPPVKVRQVLDGDTVILGDGRHLRFIGLNTPEHARRERPAEPLAGTATRRLQQLLARDPRLRLQVGREAQDHYGRLLAHPFLTDGRNLTARLLQEGLGFQVVVPPNLGYLDCYRAAERQARRSRRGVWADPWFRPRPAATLTPADTGFRRVTGTVTRVGESRRAWWLNLGRGFALRILKRDTHYFATPPAAFAGQTLTVRGWVYYVQRRRELRMNLRHPAMIEGRGTRDEGRGTRDE